MLHRLDPHMLGVSESDGRSRPLQEDARIHAGAAPEFLRLPYERPVRALILLIFLILIALDFLPFYVNLRGTIWRTLLDYEDSFDTPVGFAAGLLGCIFVLVAVAGGRAQKQALRSCPSLLHPQSFTHVVNLLLLAGAIPWWLHERSARTDVDASDLFDGWGYISGEACKLMMGLCLLPIARQSLWLNAAAAGYPEGIAFHRVTGWWCVAQVVIHTVCYTVTEAMEALSDYESWERHPNNRTGHVRGPIAIDEFEGKEWQAAWRALQVFFLPWVSRLNSRTGEQEPNTGGIFIFVGLIGMFAAITLAVFSMPRMRRARYDLFYAIHVPAAALFIVMGGVHIFEMQVFVVPGLVTYFLDRTDFFNRTSSSRFHRMTARVRVMTADWIRLDLVSSFDEVASEGAYGTQFAYLRVPALGGESHAFSLASRCPSIVIKGRGDWTKRLHDLVVTQATESLQTAASDSGGPSEHNVIPTEQLSSVTTELVVEIDGVYGNVSPPWRAFSHVLFVGGGVGVTPWLPAMEEHQELHRLHGSMVQTMRLVWIGRDHTELKAMRPYLPVTNTTVYLTRAAAPDTRVPLGASCEVSTKPQSVGQGHSTGLAQHAVGKTSTRPWLFAFVGVASLCLTQMSYYYTKGIQSVYVDYERGCGKGCFEGEPDQTQYFLARVLPVACSFVVIAVTTIFARWASRCMASLKCPCFATGASAVAGPQSMPRMSHGSSQQREAAPRVSVEFGRPDMAALIGAAVTEVMASPAAPSSITAGLFVCVCGPETLVQSCKDAVREAKNRHKGVAVGLHVEEPDW